VSRKRGELKRKKTEVRWYGKEEIPYCITTRGGGNPHVTRGIATGESGECRQKGLVRSGHKDYGRAWADLRLFRKKRHSQREKGGKNEQRTGQRQGIYYTASRYLDGGLHLITVGECSKRKTWNGRKAPARSGRYTLRVDGTIW